ncbi:MAG: M48 family metalloprotease [Alphaproteobacteria bacterium]
MLRVIKENDQNRRKLRLTGWLLAAVMLSGCVIETVPPPSRRSPLERSASRSYDRVDPRDAERLRRVVIPLLNAMDHRCRRDEVQIAVSSDSEINAANAGDCQFVVTTGLLMRANDEELRGVMAHEIAHQDLGHVAKAQVLGAGLDAGAALLQQLFPGSGALTPIAGTLIARSYGRKEEYEADRHAVEILQRAGYSKNTMIDTLTWIRRVAGTNGGGFLSTHPALDDRIAELQRLR